jgi:hypothetical protein
MTLILTCLTHKHIVQVSDRRLTRLNGELYDDDTNKTVFFNGQIAVAYTGLAFMEGKATAEWIGMCMKDSLDIEPAIHKIAKRADWFFRRLKSPDKRLAVIATGWGLLHGEQPPRPFISVASNFLSDSFQWMASASNRMVVQTICWDERSSHIIVSAGQNLMPEELVYLNRLVRRAVKHGATAKAPARLLANLVQSVANGTDHRAERVGNGMMIQLLSRKALKNPMSPFLTGLTPENHSFQYFSAEGRTTPWQSPVIVWNKTL